jgi:hypothetical protein
MKFGKHPPSPATVIAALALFVVLGGVGVAATGGNFILGKSNTADNTTGLSSGVTDAPTLEVTNTSGKPAAKFNATGTSSFAVSNAKKIQSLNADLLDGVDSSGFIQGAGHVYTGHVENIPIAGSGPLLTLPGALTVSYLCQSDFVFVNFTFTKLRMVVQAQGGAPFFMGPAFTNWGTGYPHALMLHIVGSRPFVNVLQPPRTLVDVVVTGAWDPSSSTCTFQASGRMSG